jgi:hypothetical protein
MVIVALLGLAGMHAVLIGGQVRLDAMRGDVAAETEAIRRLELRVAELESPDRVLDVARDRLGMVLPTEVGYLLPVGLDGVPAEPVRVEPAPARAAEAEAEAEAEGDAGTGTGTDVEADGAGDSPELAADQVPEGGLEE